MENDPYRESLRKAIRARHGAKAVWLESVPVLTHGLIIQNGAVEVFTLVDHPKVTRCYAWAIADPERLRKRYVIILELPPVVSPQSAVKAAVARIR